MISVLIICYNTQLAEEIHDLCSYNTALMSDELLSVKKYRETGLLWRKNRESPTADLIFYEMRTVVIPEELLQLRADYPEAEIVIIASLSISPEYYVTPDIRPALFLSINGVKRKEQIHNLFVHLLKRMRNCSEDRLIIDIKEGKRYLTYDHIICFEAFEKKIKVSYNQEKLSFYGSLKELERVLPSGFIRCHRSYIVNAIYIKEMNHKQNILILQNELVVPISKKFKNNMIHQLNEMKMNSIKK